LEACPGGAQKLRHTQPACSDRLHHGVNMIIMQVYATVETGGTDRMHCSSVHPLARRTTCSSLRTSPVNNPALACTVHSDYISIYCIFISTERTASHSLCLLSHPCAAKVVDSTLVPSNRACRHQPYLPNPRQLFPHHTHTSPNLHNTNSPIALSYTSWEAIHFRGK
jgi:hypothetical protein